MKVTFRKVTESKIPKESKPNEKDLNKKTTKGTFSNDILKTSDKKIANTPKDTMPKTLRNQKSAKQVVERNDFIPQGPAGLNDELEDKDRQIQLAATHNTENPVAESGIIILSFDDFVNEADDFKAQFEPVDAEGGSQFNASLGTEDDDDDVSSSEAPEENEDDDNETEDANDDSWYMGDEGTEDENEPDVINTGGDETNIDNTQEELNSVNAQITQYLKDYKDGNLNIQQYKEKVSPLLSTRKELQAKMDQVFNMSLDGDGEEDGTPDGNLRF